MVHRWNNGGLIPACAGKTHTDDVMRKSCKAHPRVCGENDALSPFSIRVMGSSPRVRGKLVLRSRVTIRSVAHPRVCGENPHKHDVVGHGMGSSPRVRGKLIDAVSMVAQVGLIPACAGKTEQR